MVLAITIVIFILQLLVSLASLLPDYRPSFSDVFIACLALWPLLAASLFIRGNPLLLRFPRYGSPAEVRSYRARRAAVWTALPSWLKPLAVVVCAYLILSFFAAVIALRNGLPMSGSASGEYWVSRSKSGMSYSKVSESEHFRLQRHCLRLFCSVTACVSGLSVISFAWDKKRRRDAG